MPRGILQLALALALALDLPPVAPPAAPVAAALPVVVALAQQAAAAACAAQQSSPLVHKTTSYMRVPLDASQNTEPTAGWRYLPRCTLRLALDLHTDKHGHRREQASAACKHVPPQALPFTVQVHARVHARSAAGQAAW